MKLPYSPFWWLTIWTTIGLDKLGCCHVIGCVTDRLMGWPVWERPSHWEATRRHPTHPVPSCLSKSPDRRRCPFLHAMANPQLLVPSTVRASSHFSGPLIKFQRRSNSKRSVNAEILILLLLEMIKINCYCTLALQYLLRENPREHTLVLFHCDSTIISNTLPVFSSMLDLQFIRIRTVLPLSTFRQQNACAMLVCRPPFVLII